MGFERGTSWALLRRPSLAVEGIRAWFAMRRRGGIAPSTRYLDWRHFTAYGGQITTMRAHDLFKYLAWRREMRWIRKRGRET